MKKINKALLYTITSCLLLFNFSYANIIKDDIYLIKDTAYSFREVCKTMTKRESPLIQAKSITKLDCMGSIVNVGDYCFKQQAEDPYYIRGLVDNKKNQVICKSARSVIVKYTCSATSSKRYCEDKEVGCYRLQQKLARRLKTIHASLININDNNKELNCYFAAKNINELNDFNI